MGEHWITLIVGIILVVLGLSGIITRTPRGRWLSEKFSPLVLKLVYIGVGGYAIILSLLNI